MTVVSGLIVVPTEGIRTPIYCLKIISGVYSDEERGRLTR